MCLSLLKIKARGKFAQILLSRGYCYADIRDINAKISYKYLFHPFLSILHTFKMLTISFPAYSLGQRVNRTRN